MPNKMYELSLADIDNIRLSKNPNPKQTNDPIAPFLKPFINVNGPNISIISNSMITT